MEFTDLIEKTKNLLATDPDILDWCLETYEKYPTVYVGMNRENPAPKEDYPIIAITDLVEIHGNAVSTRTFDMAIGCGILDDGITETAAVEEVGEETPELRATVKEHDGISAVESLRGLVEAALKKARFAKVTFETESGSFSTYPLFVSFTVATVEVVNCRRRQV